MVSHWDGGCSRNGDVPAVPAVRALAKDQQQAAVHPHPAGLFVDVAEDAGSVNPRIAAAHR